jgi:glycolate oxidase subunit GlcD
MTQLQELNFLAADQIRTDAESLKTYGKDWTTYFDIKASAILFPTQTEQVAQIVAWARKNKISLIPSGGRTGLSGAACALNGEVVVSFEKMNHIKNFNPIEQTVVCEAGVITEALQNWATEKNLYYPVDFAARGSSQIGGNVATNAGGIKVIRYGMTRNWIAGLKVVTGAGDILNLNNSLIKNATGYDLRHLMIGSEGTLGFVTEVTIQLTNPAPPLQVLFLAVPNLDAIMNIFSEFKKHTRILAFEMLSELAMKYVEKNGGLGRPLETSGEYYLVIETEKVFPEDEENILKVFENGLEKGWILDGTMAQSDQQSKTFWRIREDITECLSRYTPYKNDISVTTSQVPAFMNDLDQVLKSAYPSWEVVWFGHVGDGNLHISILRPEGMTKEKFVQECRQVDRLLFEVVHKYQGSISAEHGVGLTKKAFLNYTRSETEIEIMRGIKKVFDPDHILNPGKVF